MGLDPHAWASAAYPAKRQLDLRETASVSDPAPGSLLLTLNSNHYFRCELHSSHALHLRRASSIFVETSFRLPLSSWQVFL